MSDAVYLDYAATAPLRAEALAAMEPYLRAGMAGMPANANANALYAAGRTAYRALEEARRQMAASIGAGRPDEVVFTSGATEADNAALIGLAQAAAEARDRAQSGAFTGHVIVSAIEHDAVLKAASRLERLGFQVDHLRPTRAGFIEVRALEQALRDNTVLVSVQAANSEVGSIQPVEQLAAATHAAGALFHTDAAQALGKTRVDVGAWGCDAASFSGHKIGAPKGVGALYLRARTPFAPQALGGGQESGRRSGTQDVCSAAALAAACAAAVGAQEEEAARLMRLRERIYAAAREAVGVVPTVEVEPGSLDYLPNIAHVMVPGIESETLVLRFDALGIAVAGGSACSSHSLDPSHVLRALGIRGDDARCALRVSMGHATGEADVDAFLAALPAVMEWKRG